MSETGTSTSGTQGTGGRPTRPSGPPPRPSATPRRNSSIVDLFAQVVPLRPAPVERLMTFEELQQKIGSKPKKDRLGGLYKMSARYKDMGRALEQAQAQVRSLTVADLDSDNKRLGVEVAIGKQLDDIKAAGERYRKKHKGKKGDVVKTLLEDVERFRGELPGLLDRLAAPGAKEWPEDLSVNEAMAAERLGITPDDLEFVSGKHCRFDTMNDSKETAPGVELGGGAINKPVLLTYGDTKRVWKKKKSEPGGATVKGVIGIKDPPRFGNRNVASAMVGSMLGTKVMPESGFGVHDGKVGLVMSAAPGQDLKKLKTELWNAKPRKSKADWVEELSPKARASLQRQMIELEVCDILTGQADRHDGNYMLHVEGDEVTVTGIDNDLCFGTATKNLGGSDGVPMSSMFHNAIRNMPLLIGKEMAEKIKALDFDRDVAPQYRAGGLLDDDQIDAARHRHAKLRDHVLQLERTGYVVTNWETWTTPDGKKKVADVLTDSGSLYNRDFYS